ncbi:MAG: hypothetical protein RLW62_12015 [Gammaproteobacteria bacterium]
MSMPRRIAFAAILCGALAMPLAASGAGDAAADCNARDGFTPVCGVQRPEDIEVLPGGALLISEYGGLAGAHTGRLTLYRPDDGDLRALYPGDGAADGDPDWGAADCPGAPGAELDPHGIHHGPSGGADRVLVVNHRGREAVELFEVMAADTPSATRLVWRGCVPAPAEVWMNDVVGLPGGGFAVSHMVPRGTDGEALFEAERTRGNSGHVLTWMPREGWRKLPGSDGALPNGLEVSDDGDILYVNEYFGDRVYALERASGRRLWSTAVDAPDNASWGADGRLLVASHHADLEAVLACDHDPLVMCPLPFSIVAIDPVDGRRVTVVEGGGPGAPMGAATVAVEHAGRLWLGSYVGDRMAATKRGTGVRP